MNDSQPLAGGRTFNLRSGRRSPRRERALEELYPKFGVRLEPGVALDLKRLFGRGAPKLLEIGSGMGESTAQQAAAEPERDFLAVEVHPPGIADLLLQIESRGLENLRIWQGDVLTLLRDHLAPESLDVIQVFFPDPWPKKRHVKRRLIRPDRAALLRDRLVHDGLLHCATDWADYAEQMLEVLEAEPQLRNLHADYAPRPEHRPVSKFEQRGIDAGRRIYDLEFRRV